MTIFTRRRAPLAGLALCVLPCAHADDASASSTSAWTLTGNASIASQYVSRGFRQTWGKPAAQAGIDIAHSSGWSAGSWVSTVSKRYIENGKLEWDLYGGYSGKLGALGYNLSALYYR